MIDQSENCVCSNDGDSYSHIGMDTIRTRRSCLANDTLSHGESMEDDQIKD